MKAASELQQVLKTSYNSKALKHISLKLEKGWHQLMLLEVANIL